MTTTEWGQPAPLDLGRARAPFPVHALPPVMGDFVSETAANIQVDPSLVAMPSLSAVATADGPARIHVNPLTGWVEPGAIWTLGSALPGSRKTSAYAAAIKPLKELEKLAVKADQSTRTAAEVKVKVAEKAVKDAEAALEIALSDPASTVDPDEAEQAVHDACAAAAQVRHQVGYPPRLDVGSWATSERLHDLLAQYKSLGMFVPEGDTLFKGLLPTGRLERAIFLQSWSMEDHRRELVGRSTGIAEHPNLDLSITVQPSVIVNALKAGDDLSGTGFFDRFLVAAALHTPPQCTRTMDLGDLAQGIAPNGMSPATEAWWRLIYDAGTRTLAGRGAPSDWYLAPGAGRVADALLAEWDAYRASYSSSSPGALSKMNGQAMRLARVFAVAQPTPVAGFARGIGAEAVKGSWELAWWCFREHEYLFGDQLGADVAKAELAVVVLRKLRQLAEQDGEGSVTVTRLAKRGLGRYPSADITAVLEALATGGWVQPETDRYGTRYHVHPQIGYWLDTLIPKGAAA
ncbi:MAG: DUF3987 domain-containing protein [Mycobacterium sp.]|nr:DUF3987 domain-containing protein [Mycobacterium sp.]